jgi:hypothetical protein
MKSNPIVIDGKTYYSVDEMAPDVRANYDRVMRSLTDPDQKDAPDAFDNTNILGDRDGNGIPDIFENTSTQITSNLMRFIVNGTELTNLEDLPPEARAKYERAMETMDKNRNGIPDFVEGMIGTAQQASTYQNTHTATPSRPRQPMNTSPTISPDTSNGWTLVLASGFLLFLCALGAAGVWYFFLR